MSLHEEKKMKLESGEGPFGVFVCPSRELAAQCCETFERWLVPLNKYLASSSR